MMGVGVPQNKREGAPWFAKSAAGGDKHGMDNLKRAKEEGSI
jgi:TPR repeat protein